MPDLIKDEEKRTVLFLAVSLPALIVSFFDLGKLPVDAAWLAIVLCGIPIVKGAVVGLVTKFDIKADVLVSIALIASVAIGQVFAAGEVAFIMALGAWLESRTVAKARAGIEKLVHLTPTVARVVRGEEETVVPAEEVKPGDILRVLAGETVAVDGAIVAGQSSIDQSVMTGESLPVDKSAGDEVYSGTVNQFGTFDMVAQKVGEDSALQRMIRLVESADAGKAKIVGIADRWATWIVVTALLAAFVTWLATGEIIRSVTILVVFCPCALVLATPTAIMAGIGNATKYGILVRVGDALERLAQVRRIAFDKTGTLTYGKPAVTKIRSCDPALDEDALLGLAAISELRSEHPLGKAVVDYYRQTGGRLPAQPEDFRLLAGRGVYAAVGNQEIFAGNEALMAEQDIPLPEALVQAAAEAKAEGSTVIYLARNKTAAGMLALSDTLRSDAAKTVEAIHQTGVQTILLTGDAPQTASHVARLAGIADMRAGCLPEDKLETIRAYQKGGEPVCMVGDGINDAPALKAAHVGIAMGGIGSDIAIDAADIVLVGDDIREIPHLLKLAKKTMRTIRINLTASMALNAVAIILAISGILTPVLGALVHNAGSVAVIINSSLLLKWRR
ncbi:copper-(or silver)-translocating P-type ATPase [Sporobacter termitidis DSM 10068]|uniref:Cd(2+)-exporting ATPase n=1 Tax=Sporobacter termitidis DSM 10068 TaxID=1123282 RepID=A0A1M5XIG7_9FIRM|nr:cation-translocating P-type ATPase [Sporobacter termitidis]SHH99348.1 copper-(or silver)-translocating P-type ATPase [Sporobacter termitidis DSM 10068]